MNYHFIGIGGIGMSALARVLLERGESVQGSDLKRSNLVNLLEKKGAKIRIGHQAEMVQVGDRVVVSSDIRQDNVELVRAKELQLELLHRSDLLHRLIGEQMPLLVAGTHGKTTTSSLLAATLLEAGFDPSFVIGGILSSLNTNGKAGRGLYFVAEADESDGSFLKTPAFGAIVTNLEKEHLNYWKNESALQRGFSQFLKNVKEAAHLFWCSDDAVLAALHPNGISYGFGPLSSCRIENFSCRDRGISFDLVYLGKRYSEIELALFGRHNALNGAAVFGLALSLGIPDEAIRSAFKIFCGVGRRLEQIGSFKGIEIYDDYGHHPTEIAATLNALKGKGRLIAIFQPHRFSRVHDLFEEFLNCFDDADELIMTDIYAAGEVPISGITTELLYEKLREKLKKSVLYFSRQNLESEVAARLKRGDIALTLGAGDITSAGKIILAKMAGK